MQIAAGSEDAFRILFNHYKGKLYHYILKIADSPEAAEDAVHDVFLKVWENRTQFTEVENFNSYLYRMAYNHAVNGFRRMAKQTLILAELSKENTSFQTADPLSQKEIRNSIREAVAKLSPQQRKVFLLNRRDGLRHKEIADELGISVNTVRSHLQEATKLLRTEIGRTYGPLAIAIFVLYRIS